MSIEKNQNNSIKITDSSIRQYTKEAAAHNENVVKILPGKHKKFVDEKEESSIMDIPETPKSTNLKKKKICNFNKFKI